MSKLETNTIDTISGTNTLQVGDGNVATINLGKSGDTINVPSGATLNVAGTVGTGLTNTPAFLALGNNSSDQTIANATNTKVTNITENLDTDGAFASSRFTVPSGKGGTYFLFFNSRYNTATDIENINITIWKGGSSGTQIANAQGSSFYYNSFNATGIAQLNAGDYVEAFTYQGSGGNLALSGSPIYTFFGGFKLI